LIQGAVILGSGLGAFADTLENARAIPYAEIPHFAPSNVSGHAGRLVIGEAGRGDSGPGLTIACMQGRFHYYEGHDMATVTFPVRVLRELGAEFLIVTNVSGGIRSDLMPGTLMLIRDHINLMGDNPLRGPHDNALGPRFPDMTEAYDADLRRLAREVAAAQQFSLSDGVYIAVSGPSYETPAEIRMFAALGADAVGMSTVPEVIVARQLGLRVLGLSLIANAAAGLSPERLSHTDVLAAAEQGTARFVQLLQGIFQTMSRSFS
jgi:purine-nucleoside phosphorylase